MLYLILQKSRLLVLKSRLLVFKSSVIPKFHHVLTSCEIFLKFVGEHYKDITEEQLKSFKLKLQIESDPLQRMPDNVCSELDQLFFEKQIFYLAICRFWPGYLL